MQNYRTATRDDNENIIKMLAAHYPKTFFENPRQRRPLKKNIALDIVKDKSFDVMPRATCAAVNWYEQHIGYDYATIAGAKRVDLNGDEVDTVTDSEAAEARANIASKGEQIRQRRNPVEVLHKLYADGLVTDCGVKKMDASPTSRTKAVAVAPEFAALYEVLTIANGAVIAINDPTIRLAVAKATLEEVIKKAGQVREELKGDYHG